MEGIRAMKIFVQFWKNMSYMSIINGVGWIPAGSPIADESFSTVSDLDFDMCMISTRDEEPFILYCSWYSHLNIQKMTCIYNWNWKHYLHLHLHCVIFYVHFHSKLLLSIGVTIFIVKLLFLLERNNSIYKV